LSTLAVGVLHSKQTSVLGLAKAGHTTLVQNSGAEAAHYIDQIGTHTVDGVFLIAKVDIAGSPAQATFIAADNRLLNLSFSGW
jgi:hypothetical protein